MQDLGQYILSVGMGALLAGIIADYTDGKSTTGTITRMVCGLFLAFTVINPLTSLNYGILESFSQNLEQSAEPAVAAGTAMAEESMAQLIKQETRSYILDKATQLGCELDAEVTVGQGQYPLPESVAISGNVTNQQRRELEAFMETELGIPKEKQQWIG